MDELVPLLYKADSTFEAEIAAVGKDEKAFLASYLPSPRVQWKTVSWNDLLAKYQNSWVNVETPPTPADFNGKVVILDFFTYCCINCMHILPYLKRLESVFAHENIRVVGVHSAKFLNEKSSVNVANAVARYEIDHPVINDVDLILWHALQIHCWPTVVVIGPDGKLLFWFEGEGRMGDLEKVVGRLLDYYRLNGGLDGKSASKNVGRGVRALGGFSLSAVDSVATLTYPGKVALSPSARYLAISDSGHHRILIVDVDREGNRILAVIGESGRSGLQNGDFSTAQFHCPQGLCWLDEDTLFVADTENHSIRKIDIRSRRVTTVGGVGCQGHDLLGGKVGEEQEISSPWDVAIFESETKAQSLVVAAAGTHQIWILPLSEAIHIGKRLFEPNRLYCLAGNGHEAAKNNAYPHQAAFAQPSGLCINGVPNSIAFVADSESSSVRAVDLKTGGVKNVVGGDKNPDNLFAFGDVDGVGFDAKLQHPLGICFCQRTGMLYMADSYNHKIKAIDPATRTCQTLNMAFEDVVPKALDEPGGICIAYPKMYIADTNNHRILTVDMETWRVSQLHLSHPDVPTSESIDGSATETDSCGRGNIVELASSTETAKIRVLLTRVADYEINQGAPHAWKLSCGKAAASFHDRNGKVSGELRFVNHEAIIPDLRMSAKKDDASEGNVLFYLDLVAYVCNKKSGLCSVLTKKYGFKFSDSNDCLDNGRDAIIDLKL